MIPYILKEHGMEYITFTHIHQMSFCLSSKLLNKENRVGLIPKPFSLVSNIGFFENFKILGVFSRDSVYSISIMLNRTLTLYPLVFILLFLTQMSS